jgi:hypothetical protein
VLSLEHAAARLRPLLSEADRELAAAGTFTHAALQKATHLQEICGEHAPPLLLGELSNRVKFTKLRNHISEAFNVRYAELKV